MSDQANTVTFQQPSVGRIVHFHTPNVDKARAALVLDDTDPTGRYGTCTLKVFNTIGTDTVVEGVLYRDAKAEDAANWWSWPERV